MQHRLSFNAKRKNDIGQESWESLLCPGNQHQGQQTWMPPAPVSQEWESLAEADCPHKPFGTETKSFSSSPCLGQFLAAQQ